MHQRHTHTPVDKPLESSSVMYFTSTGDLQADHAGSVEGELTDDVEAYHHNRSMVELLEGFALLWIWSHPRCRPCDVKLKVIWHNVGFSALP